MTFFQQPKFRDQQPQREESPQDVPPHMVVIDGGNLIKLVEDNPEIPEGKTDIQAPFGWVPLNYNPETGEMK
jgi:hypothetical protein